MRVFIGYDEVEQDAAMVAAKSLREITNGELVPEFLWVDKLAAQGLYWRPVDHRGQTYDLISGAPASTDFAASRFLTPILCQSGWALFVDCDVVFLEDPREMLREAVGGYHCTSSSTGTTRSSGRRWSTRCRPRIPARTGRV